MINKEDIDKLNVSNEEISSKALELARLLESLGMTDSAGYKNMIAIKNYTTSTREMMRSLQEEHQKVLTQVKQQNLTITQLQTAINQIRAQVYQNNATGQ